MPSAHDYDCVVVGAGPNGLAAAVLMARAGHSVLVIEAHDRIGGGARSTLDPDHGVVHDTCSAVHPLGALSPAFRTLGLEGHGLEWCRARIDLAHPLDGGRVALLYRSVDDTAAGLGRDGARWARTFGPLAARYDDLAADLLGPLVRVPRHPLLMARFASAAARSARGLAHRWQGEEARALFAGCAAHAMAPLGTLGSAAAGVALIAAGHAGGWPVAAGGSQAVTDTLGAALQTAGGEVITGRTVRHIDELPSHRTLILDVGPPAAARILAGRLSSGVRRAYERWRYGIGAFKLDLVVEGGIPWAAPDCADAGTLHLGGTFEEIAAAEAATAVGAMPLRPLVLVAQQYRADPSRSQGNRHPVWAYCHVPQGYEGDATDAILGQIERFAPGARAHIVAVRATGPAEYAAYNPNNVGGDIGGGMWSLRQALVRPRVARNPYATGVPGVFICSASTPPGAGVHGMSGAHAAAAALRHLQDRPA